MTNTNNTNADGKFYWDNSVMFETGDGTKMVIAWLSNNDLNILKGVLLQYDYDEIGKELGLTIDEVKDRIRTLGDNLQLEKIDAFDTKENVDGIVKDVAERLYRSLNSLSQGDVVDVYEYVSTQMEWTTGHFCSVGKIYQKLVLPVHLVDWTYGFSTLTEFKEFLKDHNGKHLTKKEDF